MADTSRRIMVYGASWCPDARRARRFFDEHGIDYEWVDIDQDNAGRDLVRNINRGEVIIPVIVFPDESILVEPGNYELAKKMEALLDLPQT